MDLDPLPVASDTADFPYLDPRACWVLVTDAGEVLSPSSTAARLDAVTMLRQGTARLFISLPGASGACLFQVIDPAQPETEVMAEAARLAGL